MALLAFSPQGNTQLVNGTTTPVSVQVCTGGQQGMYVANASSAQSAFVAFSSTGVVASAPTTSAPAVGACIPPWTAHAFTVPPGSYLSVASTGGTVPVYATPGFGQ